MFRACSLRVKYHENKCIEKNVSQSESVDKVTFCVDKISTKSVSWGGGLAAAPPGVLEEGQSDTADSTPLAKELRHDLVHCQPAVPVHLGRQN
eukprot:scaffold101164_cov33-Prasinocladus_malaysianus.AAC.1